MAEAVTQVFAPKPAKDVAQPAACGGRHRDRQDARLSRAGVAVGRASRAARCGCRPSPRRCSGSSTPRAEAVRRRRGAREEDRRPQGPRELSVPAQPRGCAAGRVRRPRGDPRAAGRALGGLQQGRRHGRRRPAGLAAEPVPPRRRDRADRPARRMRLCRLPALSPLLHRARRAGEPRGRHRHRQSRFGDGQCRARPRGRAGADPVRRGPSSVRRRRFDLRGRVRRAGSDRAAALDRRAGRPLARTAARACGAADGCRVLR